LIHYPEEISNGPCSRTNPFVGVVLINHAALAPRASESSSSKVARQAAVTVALDISLPLKPRTTS